MPYVEINLKEMKSLVKQQAQSTSNAFYTICFSVLKNVSIWAYFDLDYIIGQGDNLMKCSGVRKPLANNLYMCRNQLCSHLGQKISFFIRFS